MHDFLNINAFLTYLLGQADAPQGPGMEQFLFPLLLLAGMYFLIIAPQMKKQKEHQKMLANLKPGQKIITSGGIYGTIQKVQDHSFLIKVGEKQTLEIGRAFIHAKVEKDKPVEAPVK